MQHHEHCLTYCAVSASENWRSLTENFARVGSVWVSVEPNIRWHYDILLWSSRSDVRKLSVSHGVSVVLSVGHHEKLCFIVSSFEAGTMLLWKMCSRFIQWDIWDGFCVIDCGIYVHLCQQKSIGLKFSKSQTGNDMGYSCHHNSSRFTFPIFAHSCRFSVLHSLQSITPRIY